MRYNSHNYHKSSTVERFASDLNAVEDIIGFRRRNRKVFNFIIGIFIAIAVLIIACLVFIGYANSLSSSPNASFEDTNLQLLSFDSCNVITSSQMDIEATIFVDLSALVLQLDYLDADGNIFYTDQAVFEHVTAGQSVLTINTDNGIDLFSYEIIVSVV